MYGGFKFMNLDNKYMHLAIKEAKKAYEENEVPIGAVIVKDNKVIARAYNQKEKYKNACAHAEILAIQKASKKLNNWRLINCTMYVTLEPCAMCASAINQARISRLVYSLKDESNGAVNSKIKLYKFKTINNPPKVKILEDKEYKLLIQKFFKDKRNKR